MAGRSEFHLVTSRHRLRKLDTVRKPASPLHHIRKSSGQLLVMDDLAVTHIASATLIGKQRVETSLHGYQTAEKMAKRFGADIVLHFGGKPFFVRRILAVDQNEDSIELRLNKAPKCPVAPAKGSAPKFACTLYFAHSPDGVVKVDTGQYMPCAQAELQYFGMYPSKAGSCGGSLYVKRGGRFVRLGPHRYSSAINAGVKTFGAASDQRIPVAGDTIHQREFEMVPMGFSNKVGPRPERSRSSMTALAYPAGYGPDRLEGKKKKRLKSSSPPNFEHVEKRGRYTSKVVVKSVEENHSGEKDESHAPIRGIRVYASLAVKCKSKKYVPGEDGIPLSHNAQATFIISPNPHQFGFYENKCEEFYGAAQAVVAAHVNVFYECKMLGVETPSFWPKDGVCFKFRGTRFYLYRQGGKHNYLHELAAKEWYGQRPETPKGK